MSQTTKPGETVARFLTQGGAHVEVDAHRFRTRLLYANETLPKDAQTRECDGFRWECKGCRATSATNARESESFSARTEYGWYLDDEYGHARRDANRHAAECRAVPLDSPWPPRR